MLARIQIRRDSKTNWDTNNPILHAGEIGYETLTERFKIGDGVTNWLALPYQLGHWDGQTNGDISFGYQLGENNVNIANNLQIDGNLFVKGTTVTVNTKEFTFDNRVLTLNWNEDPIKHYDSSLISGLDVNIGWPDTAFAPAYSGVDFSSVSDYDSTNNETVITLNSTLSNWPATYKQNYVIYFSPSEPFGDPDLAFFIKSYDSITNELTVTGDASSVPNTKDFEIHNVIRQLYWKNDANSADAAWYVDGNKIWHEGNLNIASYLPLSGGTLTGNLEISKVGTSTIQLTNTDVELIEGQITGELNFYQSDSTSAGTGYTARIATRSSRRPDDLNSHYGNAADLGFWVGSVTASNNADLEAMTIRAGGNVGIGTTSPATLLHLKDITPASDNVCLRLENDAQVWDLCNRGFDGDRFTIYDVTADNVPFKIEASSPTNSFYIKSDGSVGIGTSNPSAPLHIKSATDQILKLQTTDQANFGPLYMGFYDSVDAQKGWFGYGSGGNEDISIWNKEVGAVKFATSDNPRMTIDSTGNVGIGTSSPYKKLEVAGDLQLDSNNASLYLKSGAAGTTGKVYWTYDSDTAIYGSLGLDYDTRTTLGMHLDSGYPITLDSASTINFSVNGTTKMRMLSNGKFGLGTTNPEALLTLRLDTGIGFLIEDPAAERLHMLTRDGSGHGYYIGYADGETVGYKLNSSGDSYFVGGNVGIGTSSPDVPLHIYKNHTSGTGEWLNIGFDDINPKKIEMGSSSYHAYMSLYNASNVENVKLNSSGDSYFLGGNVGIGTATPSSKLTVNGDTFMGGGDLVLNTSSNTSHLYISRYGSTSNEYTRIGRDDATTYFTTKNDETSSAIRFQFENTDTEVNNGANANSSFIHFQGDNSETFISVNGDKVWHAGNLNPNAIGGQWTVSSNDIYYNTGNVAIGTSTQSTARLTVDSSTGNLVAKFQSSDANAYISFADNSTSTPPLVGAVADDFSVWTANTRRMTILNSNGNVGIGTTSPASPLHVVGSATGSDLVALNLTNKNTADGTGTAIRFTNSTTEDFLGGEIAVERQSDSSNDLRINLKNADSTATYPRMLTIDGSTGRVGIGTTSPSRPLHVMDLTNDGSGGVKVSSYLPVIELQDMSANAGSSKIQQDQLDMKIGPIDSNTYLSFNTQDTLRMRIDKDGKVGIGTLPSYELHVRKDQNAKTNIALQNHNTGTSADSEIFIETKPGGGDPFVHFQIDGTETYTIGIDNSDSDKFKISDGYFGTNDRLTIDSSGKVGIGTTGPSADLHIYNNNASQGAYLKITDGALSPLESGIILERMSTNTDYKLINDGNFKIQKATDASSWTNFMTITPDGDIGVGTTAPSLKFDIQKSHNGATGLEITNTTNNTAAECQLKLVPSGNNFFIRCYSDNFSGKDQNLTEFISTAGSSEFAFSPSNSEGMRIDSSGNVGINTTTPDTKLNIESNTSIGNETLLRLQRLSGHGDSGFNQYYNSAAGSDPVLWGLNFGLEVSNDTNGKVGIKFESTSGTTTTSDKIIFRTANSDKVVIDNSGNVGIGTTTPTEKLDVVGNIKTSGSFIASNFQGSFQNNPTIIDNNGNEAPGSEVSHVLAPSGGSYKGQSTETGAIKITLPFSWTNTMMYMKVRIYEYGGHAPWLSSQNVLYGNNSVELHIAGYTYNGMPKTWYQTTSFLHKSGMSLKNVDYNVRFGHDGSKCCIFIGETNTSWTNPQVIVTDATFGYLGYDTEDWSTGWDVSFVTTLATNIDSTIFTGTKKNLFLDTSIARTSAGVNTTWKWGPTGGSGVTHTVADFTNFKESPYVFYEKLCFYSGSGYSEVFISDLLAINPTISSPLYLGVDDQEQFDDAQYLYFDGNDLWLVNAIGNYGGYSNTIFKYYRIVAVKG